MVSDNKNQPQTKVRYNLAKASERIFARLIDLLLMIVLSICWGCLIFLTDPNFKGKLSGFTISEPYRYFLFCVICIASYILYFICLPYWWKGQTLGKKAFKLAIYNQVFTHFFWNIFRRDFFIWELLSLVELVLSMILFIVGEVKGADAANKIIQQMYSYDSGSDYYAYAVVFASLFSIAGLVSILCVISTGIHSGHQSFNDKISNTVVVKLVDVIGSDKANERKNVKGKKIKHNYSLPGVISDSAHDTIDSLDDGDASDNQEEKILSKK